MVKKTVTTDSSPAVRSKRILSQYFSDLKENRYDPIFDDKILEVMLEYAHHPKQIHKVREYCNKIGYAQSIKEYEKLKPQLEAFSADSYDSFVWNRNFQRAKAYLSAQFKKAGLKQLHYTSDSDVADALRVKSTHAGWTYLETGKKKKGDNLEDILKRFRKACEEARKVGTFNRPILIGTRTQCQSPYDDDGHERFDSKGEIKHKTRMVSMVDLLVVICECMWAVPLQNYMSSSLDWCAGGKNDNEISRIIHHWQANHTQWFSLDYSGYDQSLSDWLLYAGLDILKCAFVNDDTFDEELWNVMCHDIVNKRFLDGDGKYWNSKKGLGSGYRFTNILGNVINLLMKTTYSFSIGRNPEDDPCIVMGDDNLMFTNVINLQHMSTYLMKNFGVTINIDKIDSGECKKDSPKFLSREWTDSGPYRESNICCAKLLYPERFRRYDSFEPEDVFYAYCLAYGKGMYEAFDVDRFLADNRYRVRDESYVRKGMEHLPGVMRYNIIYGVAG